MPPPIEEDWVEFEEKLLDPDEVDDFFSSMRCLEEVASLEGILPI